MTNKSKPISDTARALLTAAATRRDCLIRPPKLPIAATRQVVRSLLSAGLVEEVPAPIDDAGFAWRTGKDGVLLMLRATAVGIARVMEANGDPEPPPRSRAGRRRRVARREARRPTCPPTWHADDGRVTAPANAHAAGVYAFSAPAGCDCAALLNHRELGDVRANDW